MEGAIIFGALCAVEDCARKKIDGWLLLAGAAAGAVAAGVRIYQGREDWYSIFAALLPGMTLLGFSLVTEGKIGRGDGDMALILGLFLGWELCIGVLCIAFLLTAGYAGAGLAVRKLTKNSRIPLAPFLLASLIAVRIFWEGGL